jgi:hypothetical protein
MDGKIKNRDDDEGVCSEKAKKNIKPLDFPDVFIRLLWDSSFDFSSLFTQE